MLVYVLNSNGQPLMPTSRCGKVRRLLKSGKAKVVKRCPFTIRLLYDTPSHVQPVTLGVDAGSKTIGLSAVTGDREVYAGEVELRNDIVKLLSDRRELRRSRRNRKTRYRKPRFDNRTRKEGWLPPSVLEKVQTHLRVVENVCKILPVSHIVAETASFDIQKIKSTDIQGEGYQQGDQFGFWNVREYVLFRDGHTCQCCKGKSKDPVLNVHHIESRKTGGDAPNNLITLCKTCHKNYHRGKMVLPKSIHRGMRFQAEAFMGIMRWFFYNELKKIYPSVSMTYGYITKHNRITNDLPKENYVDARCITGFPKATPLGFYFFQKKVRCHNRQIHKCSIGKGGIRKRNQADYLVRGYRLFDKVLYSGKEYFIFGRRESGFFDIRTLSGEKVNKGSLSFRKLKLLETSKKYLTERRRISSPRQGEGVPCVLAL